MSDSYRALCSDFYVNMKLSVKLDLPRGRDTVLDLFERIRRAQPTMSEFKRYRDELALESPSTVAPHRWLAIRSGNVRAGVVNPDTLEQAYELHATVLEVTPYFLSISPLDVDFLELLFGFDLAAAGNHDAIVFDALLADSPLGRVMDISGARPIDCQPVMGVAIEDRSAHGAEAHVEVKTRSSSPRRDGDSPAEPISVYLTLRQHGAAKELADLPRSMRRLAALGEDIVASRVVPHLLSPLREAIARS
ncbi:MAG: hypothetical protein RBS39_03575 [Phycisphaerales bacterium]|jgi:hypothetical protein|nr:hypothetical protein [Phycisphaerales bacterium]